MFDRVLNTPLNIQRVNKLLLNVIYHLDSIYRHYLDFCNSCILTRVWGCNQNALYMFYTSLCLFYFFRIVFIKIRRVKSRWKTRVFFWNCLDLSFVIQSFFWKRLNCFWWSNFLMIQLLISCWSNRTTELRYHCLSIRI